ncbi:MAG: cobalamin B12-binding domain-containing protein [Firmicutes bacterium]|nr:cobalamin B12-binding domain-containing protein [Bacillota bacterium]
MRVLLVQPRQKPGLGFKSISVIEPLGLEMVAGNLERHATVRILDLFSPADLLPALRQFRPDACGISCSFTVDVYQTLAIARQVKAWRPDTVVFAGGHHASLTPEDLRDPAIDFIVTGEGEEAAPEALNCLARGGDLTGVPGLVLNLEDGQLATGPRDLIRDLDTLPFPARHLTLPYRKRYYLGFQRPISALETARGCPFKCHFCSVWQFYRGRCRAKSPERVVEEFRQIDSDYVLITDDNFLLDVGRAERIGELLERAGLRKRINFQARSDTIIKYPSLINLWQRLGLYKVFIGFEKIEEEELAAIGKRNTVENNERALKFLQERGIGVVASFIVDPDYDRQDFAKLRNYVRRLKISTPSFTVLTPLPGTDLYNRLKEKIVNHNRELFDFLHAVLPTRLQPQEFYRELARLYLAAYGRPGYVVRSALSMLAGLLTGRISPGQFRQLIIGGRRYISPWSYLVRG